jgi:endonuclease/exonuclease/phosphatase family metal-dependent hydrolase
MSEPTLIALPRGNAEAIKVGDDPLNAVRVELSEVPGLGQDIVYGTHLQHNNGATREAQMKALLEHAKADATTATVFIMGDMNHTPHPGEPDLLGMVKAAGFHDLAAEYAAANGVDPAATMHVSVLRIRIDYVFCSKPVDVTGVKVLHTDVSDHYPLAVTIAVK